MFTVPAIAVACSLGFTPPLEADAPDVPAPAPASDVPLDTETPEPAGLGLQRREFRRMNGQTDLDLDLDLFWDDYEEDVKEEGEKDTFAEYVASRYRVRRGLGIGLTAFGVVFTAFSPMWFYFAATTEVEIVPAIFITIGVVGAGGGITAIALGARTWRRNQLRLDELRDTGFLAGGPRWGLRAAGPIALPRGGGLGFTLAF